MRVTPKTATITARAAMAASVPTIALRQLIVTPTTRTIVKASTNSTAEARNAPTATAHCIRFILLFYYNTITQHNTCDYTPVLAPRRQQPIIETIFHDY